MHFLKNPHPHYSVGRPRAAVLVTFDSKKKALVVSHGEVFILKSDALLSEVPDDIKVLDDRGRPIRAIGKFFVTTETVNPFHAVVDLFATLP